MPLFRDIPLAFRLARREMRGGPRFFGVFLACLALGVGAVAGVGILSESIQSGIHKDARRLLGGDFEISRSHLPLERDGRDHLHGLGRVAGSIQTRTMARALPDANGSAANATTNATLVELKGVDGEYPLYGQVELASGQPLSAALARRGGLPGAVASPRLFERLGLSPGDVIRVGQADFRLTDVLLREPDRAGHFFQLGPRLLVHADDVKATGILKPGSVVRYAYSIRIPPDADTLALKTALQSRFSDQTGWRVRDFSQAAGGLKRFIDNMGRYLLLVGLATLLTGGIGVANGVRRFLDSRISSIAAMKCVGADHWQVFSAYLVQILLLALAGSGVGLGLGWAAALACGSFLSKTMNIPLDTSAPYAPLALGLACGLLTALAFSLPVLSGAARVSPVRLFSGYTDPSPRRPGAVAVLATVVCGVGLAVTIPLFTGSPKTVFGFAGAVLVGGAALGLFSRGIKIVARRLHAHGPLRLRHAVANLHRPGNATSSVLFSLGLGLTVLTAVVQLERLFNERIADQIPQTAPAYFFLDIPGTEIDSFRKTLLDTPGVERFITSPSILGRIVSVDGTPASKVEVAPDSAWILRGDRSMSYSGPLPEGTRIVEGKWWNAGYSGPPLVSFDAKAARDMGLGVGGTLAFNVLGREIQATVASLREIDWTSGRLDHAVIFSPGVLEGAPHTDIGAVYVSREAEKQVFDEISKRFPMVSQIHVRDVLKDVQEVAGTVALAVRAALLAALLTGLLILGEALKANLASRHRDAVIFKVCGATRADILIALALEFALLGFAAAATAMVLGAAMAWGCAVWLMRMDWTLYPIPLALAGAGGVAAVLLLGLTGVRKAISQDSWTILRNE